MIWWLIDELIDMLGFFTQSLRCKVMQECKSLAYWLLITIGVLLLVCWDDETGEQISASHGWYHQLGVDRQEPACRCDSSCWKSNQHHSYGIQKPKWDQGMEKVSVVYVKISSLGRQWGETSGRWYGGFLEGGRKCSL